MNLSECIEIALNHKACKTEINKIKNYNSFEDLVKHPSFPSWCHWYCKKITKGRFKEIEPFVLQSPECAFIYSKYIMKNRWEEAEEIIQSVDYYWQNYQLFLKNLNHTYKKL